MRTKTLNPAQSASAAASAIDVEAFRRVERMGTLLDDAFRIPIIGKRVGFDALIGMVPFVGDFASAILSGLMVIQARRAGAPTSLVGKMVRNVVLDVVMGLVPVVGDLFDFAFKANRRNAQLLRDHLAALPDIR